MSKKKVLIFYVNEGSGHQRAAEVMAENFIVNGEEFEARAVNIGEFIDSRFCGFISDSYMLVIRRAPFLWTYLYDNIKFKRSITNFPQLYRFLRKIPLLRFLRQEKPDIIMCTQAVPNEIMSFLKRRKIFDLPLVAVPTDFHVHTYWLNPEVNHFFVPTDESAVDLIARGVSPDQVVTTGIPNSSRFCDKFTNQELREKFGIDHDLPVVLILGGGQGLVPFHRIIKQLHQLEGKIQIISLVGTNGKSMKKIERQQKRMKNRDMVTVFSYLDDLNQLMDVADVVVGKPGGLTTSEILVKGIPLIITHPLPGQERLNAQFLVDNQAALWAKRSSEVPGLVSSIIDNPDFAARLSANALRLSQPDSPKIILEATRRILAESQPELPIKKLVPLEESYSPV